ncbi:hypothetical protein [Enterococcus rivorum]|uniref:Uncharacterized protein n=1 Tax=Enterococcus rivorum TaxID=762845 RepID=A0A1E5L0G2_9ENTE|nr:hypothetical protein [Enterococcus rivorum]MBP2098833.1 hypothetical protein [Enterococcus rivorum]OEH83564.1 hypothetical protein BCR26_08780 [Enterococcus rivorum]
MANTYFDEFSKFTKPKMAQAMEDLTYLYKETKVPKKHYEEHLSATIEELMEANVQLNLVNTYFSMLKDLYEQNPKWFFQALLCLDMKVKLTSIKPSQHQALEATWENHSSKKGAKLMDIETLAFFQNTEKNGLNR